jgi:hypothetical protein
MRRISPWIAVGFVTILGSSGTYACGGDDKGSNGGKGGTGTILEGGGGTGGDGGDSGATTTRIGKRCTKDDDCGEDGLACITAGSGKWGGQGPAQGYCSAPCGDDFDAGDPCGRFGSDAMCLDFGTNVEPALYCVLACSFGPDDLSAFDPAKCSGRKELACAPLFQQTDTECTVDANCGRAGVCDSGFCWQIKPACLPQCNSNVDCGTGLYCHQATGQCAATPKTGKPLGAPCTQPAGDAVDECQGRCIGIVTEASDDVQAYMCADSCTLGAFPSCGWNGTSSQKADAACLLSSSFISDNGGPGVGDRGSCLRLCDCNADCGNAAFACIASAPVKRAFNRAGTCDLTVGPDGGTLTGIPSCAADSGTPPADGAVKDAGPG